MPAHRPPLTAARLPLTLAAAALLASCASTPPSGGLACGRLGSALKAQARLDITDTRNVAADDKGRPAHCLVTGKLNDRQGDDGKRYAIGFEMRLPQNWNQRFLHQVNGGNDGVVVPAFGPQAATLPDALTRGFAHGSPGISSRRRSRGLPGPVRERLVRQRARHRPERIAARVAHPLDHADEADLVGGVDPEPGAVDAEPVIGADRRGRCIRRSSELDRAAPAEAATAEENGGESRGTAQNVANNS